MARRKIRFTVNTHYKGNLVGPGTDFEIVEVSDHWADTFVKNNAAVEIDTKPVQTNQGTGQQKQS